MRRAASPPRGGGARPRALLPLSSQARLWWGGGALLGALLVLLGAGGLSGFARGAAEPMLGSALPALVLVAAGGVLLLLLASRIVARLARAAEEAVRAAEAWSPPDEGLGRASGSAAEPGERAIRPRPDEAAPPRASAAPRLRGDEAARLRGAVEALIARAGGMRRTMEATHRELQAQVRQRAAEVRQTNLALAFQNEKVTEANRLKSAFFANVSHELRTPLNAILALTEMLRDGIPGPINDAQRQHLTLSYNSGVKLLNLINEVLDLSRIEAGRMEILREDEAIVDRLLDAAEELRALAEEKGLELLVEGAGDGRIVRADVSKVRQVFVNLLGNAIKFTPRGTITARVQLLGEESLLSVEVEDTGPGIPAEEQQQIFLEFHRIEGDAPRTAPGTGLGLTISKRLVHLMGGDIWVDSVVGRGSRFAFVIPLSTRDQEQESAAQEAAEAESRDEQRRPQVLLVAEDLVEAGVLGRYFRQRGIDVSRARSEFEMQRALQAEETGLVVVVADGRSPAGSIVLLEELGHLTDAPPVILYCSEPLPPEARAHADARADAVFVKSSGGLGELVELAQSMMEAAAHARAAGGAPGAGSARAA